MQLCLKLHWIENNILSFCFWQPNRSLSLIWSRCLLRMQRETLPRTKMAFTTTAPARPQWRMPTVSTLVALRAQGRAPAAPASGLAPRAGQALGTQRRQPHQRRSSPGGSRPRPCLTGCRGSWSPACQSTVTAADGAKAAPQAHRNLLYQRVGIGSRRDNVSN